MNSTNEPDDLKKSLLEKNDCQDGTSGEKIEPQPQTTCGIKVLHPFRFYNFIASPML
jgi:hypothetical protein